MSAAPLRLAAVFLLAGMAARAQTAGALPDAETQGRALAQQILAQRPSENATNTGVLQIRDADGRLTRLPVTCETIVTATNWSTRYQAGPDAAAKSAIVLTVTHAGTEPNRYLLGNLGAASPVAINGSHTMVPFAGSDFWPGDLGLEFFHWPQQKVLKKEFHRQCACTVLESTNPGPATNGYSRVVCWIDEDSLGIVEAYAYDASGQVLKNFYPKSLEKVNGRYQVESMVMENRQTHSTSRMEFDLTQ